jgi:S1-C subfamily serine protease
VTYSKQTKIFLGALAGVVLAIVAYDIWRPPEESAPVLPQVPAESLPTTRRVLDKTPLLYEGEFLQNLLSRLRPALVSARPDPDPFGIVTTGFLVNANGAVLVSLVSDAPKWQVRTAAGDLADGDLVAVDAIHGLALIKTALPDPVQVLPIASDMPLTSVEPLIGAQASPTGGDVRLLIRAGSVASLADTLGRAGMRAGEVGLDADGRLRAFGANTESGVRPLFAYEVEEIARALVATGHHPHPWTGAALQTIGAALRPRFPDGGFVVVEVQGDSPAAQAGLRPGMAFVEARSGGRSAKSSEGVENMLEVGDVVELEPVARARAPAKPITLTVADRQEPLPVWTHDIDALGLMAAEAQPGVAIVVAPGGAAEAHGLATGDVVEAVDLRAVADAAALRRALTRRTVGDRHLVTIRRDRSRFFVLIGPGDLGPSGADGGHHE